MTDESKVFNYPPEAIMARAEDIKLLWESETIQETYERRSAFQIVECARYFLSRVMEVMQPDYVPTDDDLLQTRFPTVGVVEYFFHMTDENKRNPHTLKMVNNIT